jgi:hypothetical protein
MRVHVFSQGQGKKKGTYSRTGFELVKKSQYSQYCYSTIHQIATICTGDLSAIRELLEEKKNTLTTSLSRSSISATVACYAWRLAIAHSRKLSATLGGSISTCPGVQKITLKTCNFIDISNTVILTALGGSTTTLPSIMIVIL